MSYQLRHSQTLGDNLGRICREQIEGAIAVVKGEKESRDTPVHETRKHLKKARAALRLVRKEIGRGLFREQDRCLRGVARLTSEIRDAEVRLQTVRQFQGITHRRGCGTYTKLEGMLMLELEKSRAAFEKWQPQALPMLKRPTPVSIVGRSISSAARSFDAPFNVPTKRRDDPLLRHMPHRLRRISIVFGRVPKDFG